MIRFVRDLPVLAAVLALLASSMCCADEEKIEVDKLPKAVVNAVKAKYPDGKLVSAEKETEGDKTVYEVVVKNKDQSIEITLDGDGKILEVEQEVAAKDLPKAVTKTIEEKYPKGTIKNAESSTRDEKVTYTVLLENDVVIEKEKQNVQLQLTAEGKITGIRKRIAAGDLPKAVTAALEKKYPKADIKRVNEASSGDKTSYVVMLEITDKKILAVLDGDGKILQEQSDEKKGSK
jgi:hypothetical protein